VGIEASGQQENEERATDRRAKDQVMKRLPIAKASRPLADYTAELDGEILVVTDGKRPVAALVPLNELDGESEQLGTHRGFLRLIKRSREEIAAGKSLTLDQVRRRALPSTGASKPPARSAKKRRRA
jgi:antitoxin (DNA-binding transcriptional repressor) of toxin-antitoxin stability system